MTTFTLYRDYSEQSARQHRWKMNEYHHSENHYLLLILRSSI